MTEAEIRARLEAVRNRMTELDSEFRDQRMPREAAEEFESLARERDEHEETLREIDYRRNLLRADERESRTGQGEGEQRERLVVSRESGAEFNVNRGGGEDVYDYSRIAHSAHTPDRARSLFRDQALRAVERATFHQPGYRQEDAQAHIARLLEKDNKYNELARRILDTGSPLYQRAFGKAMFQQPLSPEESRALSLTNAAGGYAVPFTLDPTIIPTSNGSINPYRRIARVIQITTTSWQGLTSAGVTVSRVAELTEAGDNSPTLAQPTLTPQRVQGFIPFSIEIEQDWGGMQSEMAQLLSDAKDDEEAVSFTTGTGVAPQAQGIVTGAATTVATSGVGTFAVGDLYKAEEALPPRFRPMAQWVGSRSIYNRARQFDTQGGASIWTESLNEGLGNNPSGNTGRDLIGYPANEASAMSTSVATGQKIGVLGDFRYFAIVDRVGMDVELVPHLFGAANRRPTGQRGWYAYWRNTSGVLDANAFRVLTVA